MSLSKRNCGTGEDLAMTFISLIFRLVSLSDGFAYALLVDMRGQSSTEFSNHVKFLFLKSVPFS